MQSNGREHGGGGREGRRVGGWGEGEWLTTTTLKLNLILKGFLVLPECAKKQKKKRTKTKKRYSDLI